MCGGNFLHSSFGILLKKFNYQWLIVLFEIALAVWTYYVYVALVCMRASNALVERVILLSVYHVLLTMCLVTYFMTLLVPRRPVPSMFRVNREQWSRMESDILLQNETRKRLGIKTIDSFYRRGSAYALNYCYRCGVIKPDRCHHCSQCNACVLRMDHHCPWLARCVGFHNHKYFIILLHYMFAKSLFLIITCAGVLPRVWRRDFTRTSPGDILFNQKNSHRTNFNRQDSLQLNSANATFFNTSAETTELSTTATMLGSTFLTSENVRNIRERVQQLAGSYGPALIGGTGFSADFLQIVVVIVVYLIIVISLVPLMHMHAELLEGNITTLEWSRPVGLPGAGFSIYTFDLGSVHLNHEQIMGKKRWLWPIPVFTTPGDGAHFPLWGDTRPVSSDERTQAIGLTDQPSESYTLDFGDSDVDTGIREGSLTESLKEKIRVMYLIRNETGQISGKQPGTARASGHSKQTSPWTPRKSNNSQ